MQFRPPFLIVSILAAALAGCGGDTELPAQAGQAGQEQAPTTPPGDGGQQENGAAAEEEAEAGFDIAKVPLSDAPLGEFPYFSLPRGYHTTDRLTSEFPQVAFPFWVGDRYIAVEGRVYMANIRADEGRNFSALEVAGNVEHVLREAGGVLLADMEVPRSASGPVLTREFTRRFANGLCWPTEPGRTYVVHRTDRAIWVPSCTYGGIGGAWVIAETGPPEPTATLLPANELRQKIDADGRVALQINFGSDSARILTGSMPQLEQVVELLQGLPGLALSVEGHTDDTGTAERNLQLSRQRAQAVVDALVERGIDPGRLTARGLGRDAPVASNETPAGRAANRRVELVRL